MNSVPETHGAENEFAGPLWIVTGRPSHDPRDECHAECNNCVHKTHNKKWNCKEPLHQWEPTVESLSTLNVRENDGDIFIALDRWVVISKEKNVSNNSSLQFEKRMVKSQYVTWVDLAENQAQESRDDDESGCPSPVGVDGKRANKDGDGEDENSTPENGGLVALLIGNFNISLDLFAHGAILTAMSTLS